MPKFYLAIDIGASSGRHIVGWRENGSIETKEIYRFTNGVTEKDGHPTWNIESLVSHVKVGIERAKAEFTEIVSLSIDTWGVDYVLMRGDEEVLPCLCISRQPNRGGNPAGSRQSVFHEALPAHRHTVPAIQYDLSALCG